MSAFVTPHGLYQYKVMPFGMKNSPATFQRLMNQVISDLDDCECYIDDVVIYSDTFEQHMKQINHTTGVTKAVVCAILSMGLCI